MIPKIDYIALGQAVAEYQKRGYHYVEAPWLISSAAVRATLPKEYPYVEAHIADDGKPDGIGALVGSAEQGLITMGLAPGAYIAVSPCFRVEPVIDLLHRPAFMKAELFVVPDEDDDATVMLTRVITDAAEVMAVVGGKRPLKQKTEDGYDLTIAGIEVGSYGIREAEGYGRWVYGTGIALPRFSVAQALDGVT